MVHGAGLTPGSLNVLVSEEAQQDMDLKSAFVPAVPRQPFFRILLGDPRQSPGGVANNLREHRTLLADLPWQQQVSLERARPDP